MTTPSAPVREATPDDATGVRQVLDAAMLDVREDLDARIERGDVLVATSHHETSHHETSHHETSHHETSDAETVLGSLVLVPEASPVRVDAVAVRRSRRGQGIGTALVEAAVERHGRLFAEFDVGVRPFYESLGFDIRQVEDGDGRLRGVFDAERESYRTTETDDSGPST